MGTAMAKTQSSAKQKYARRRALSRREGRIGKAPCRALFSAIMHRKRRLWQGRGQKEYCAFFSPRYGVSFFGWQESAI